MKKLRDSNRSQAEQISYEMVLFNKGITTKITKLYRQKHAVYRRTKREEITMKNTH